MSSSKNSATTGPVSKSSREASSGSIAGGSDAQDMASSKRKAAATTTSSSCEASVEGGGVAASGIELAATASASTASKTANSVAKDEAVSCSAGEGAVLGAFLAAFLAAFLRAAFLRAASLRAEFDARLATEMRPRGRRGVCVQKGRLTTRTSVEYAHADVPSARRHAAASLHLRLCTMGSPFFTTTARSSCSDPVAVPGPPWKTIGA